MSAIDLFWDDSFGWRRKGVTGTADSRPVFLHPSDRLSHARRVYWSPLDGQLHRKTLTQRLTHTHTVISLRLSTRPLLQVARASKSKSHQSSCVLTSTRTWKFVFYDTSWFHLHTFVCPKGPDVKCVVRQSLVPIKRVYFMVPKIHRVVHHVLHKTQLLHWNWYQCYLFIMSLTETSYYSGRHGG